MNTRLISHKTNIERKASKYILLISLAFVFTATYSQQVNFDELSNKQLAKFGANAERLGDYHTAVFFYEKYYQRNSTNIKLNYQLAELQRKIRNYEKALDLYEPIVEKYDDKYPQARFYYAQMLKSLGRYDEAIDEFTQFRRSYRGQKDSKTFSRLARYEINGCDSAKKILETPLNLTVKSLNSSINSPHIELSPFPVDESNFIYASLRVDSLVYFTDENIDQTKPVRQFYIAKKEGFDWVGGEKFPAPINLYGVETGNGTLSPDGTKFFFTRCEDNWQGKTICSIYVSEQQKDGWSDPKPLPPIINDPAYTSTQPAVGRTATRDREIIYFVSDRPDGKGGLDIWYSVFNERKQLWSRPRNCGSRVNTVADDMTPFYNMPTRTLYYSSAGQAGIGGFDIFEVLGERMKWTKPHNVGAPINSSFDDLYFTVAKTGEYGFFVSNRPGIDSLSKQTCCDDIFYYRWNDFVRIIVTGKIYPFEKDKYGRKQDLSNFDFFNPSDDIEPLEGAVIALYRKDKNSDEYYFMERFTTKDDGQFFFQVQPDQDYEFRMEGFQYFDSKNYLSTEFMNFSDTLLMPPIWVNVLTDKPVELENVYYEFNSVELKQSSKEVLDTTILVMMNEAPEFIVEIGSHTDNVGSDKDNLKLSEDRAQGVVEYLISKGIEQNRLVAKGYGESSPVAPNTNPDGSDNPEGREKNRRTEFRIIGTTTQEIDDEIFEEY